MLLALMLVLPGTVPAQTPGKFSGLFHGDYFYNIARDERTASANLPASALTGTRSMQGFVLRRVYLTYDQEIAAQFSTRFRLELDMTPSATGAYAVLANGSASVVVKDAWLRWKEIVAGSDLYFGISPASAYDLAERQWAHISLEKSIMNLRGIVSSRHLGADLRGTLDGDGVTGYWLTVANVDYGPRPKDLTPAVRNGDKYNLYSVQVSARPAENLDCAVYGDYRPSPPVGGPGPALSHATVTGSLFLCYRRSDALAAGVEAFLQRTAHEVPDPADGLRTALKKAGFSVWAWYAIAPEWELVARYDFYDPRNGGGDAEKGDARSYILAGIAFRPAANVQFIPNVQVEAYEGVPGGRSIGAAVTARVTVAASY